MNCDDSAGDGEHDAQRVPMTALLVVEGVMLLATFCAAALIVSLAL